MSNEILPFRVAMEGVIPPASLPQLFPAAYFSSLSKPIVDTLMVDLSAHLPDFRKMILDSFKVDLPDWSVLLPNVSEVIGKNFSSELAKAFAPSIRDLQKTMAEALGSSTTTGGLRASIGAVQASEGVTTGMPSPDELLTLGSAVTKEHAADPEFLDTARGTVQSLGGAEPAIDRYVASLSGYASDALELIREGIYAFVFTAWVLAILGLSTQMPEIDTLVQTAGLAAPKVAAKAQRDWDGFVEKV